jgi:hypothetical protein
MPTKPGRSSEHDIAFAVMKYLSTVPSQCAEVSSIKKFVPNHIDLTDGDKEPSETRPNEQVWQQVVGNIVSHRNDSPDNFVNRGLLAYDAGTLALTDAGVAYLKKFNAYP